MKEISNQQKKDLLIYTLQCCSCAVLNESDDLLEHYIFEEFDIFSTTYLSEVHLKNLYDSGMIEEMVKEKCSELLQMYNDIKKSSYEMSLNSVRTSKKWVILMNLADELLSELVK